MLFFAQPVRALFLSFLANGRLLAWLGSRSYSPVMAKEFFNLAKTLYRPDVVKPRNRELAILGQLSVFKAPYVTLTHKYGAAKLGISHEQWDKGLTGEMPDGLSEEEAMAYKLGTILPMLNGPISDELWKEVTAKMTKSEFVGIIHAVLGFRWVGLLEHACASPNFRE